MDAGFLVEATFNAACKGILDVINKSREFKSLFKELKSTLELITPIFPDLQRMNPANLKNLGEQLIDGKKLAEKCDKARWWNKSCYANQLIAFDKRLTRTFQIDVTAELLHSVRRMEDRDGVSRKKPKAPEKPKEPPPKPKAPEKPKEPEKPKAPIAAVAYAAGPLDFLRSSPQFQALRSLLKSNPEILQPMLEELGKKKPELATLIYNNYDEFLDLIKEAEDGSDGPSSDQVPDRQVRLDAFSVTPAAEQEAIERLEAMGFDRDLATEAFWAFERDEELAANYLLENYAGDFED